MSSFAILASPVLVTSPMRSPLMLRSFVTVSASTTLSRRVVNFATTPLRLFAMFAPYLSLNALSSLSSRSDASPCVLRPVEPVFLSANR